jgi:hypothetical protein
MKLKANFLKNVVAENVIYLSIQLLGASISWQHTVPIVDKRSTQNILEQRH